MNLPTRKGDRYLCFIVHREDRGYGGPYGMTRRPMVWRCEVCGYEIVDHSSIGFDGRPIRRDMWAMKRLADHHECGHAPCSECGQMLLRRKDGTPRQHAHNLCPGKNPGFKIEREFVRNMTAREYA